MEFQSIEYCNDCAEKSLAQWKGWPHKQAVPLLQKVLNGACVDCGGGNNILKSKKITWFNYHSEYNGGLPDYWLLEINGSRTKWGSPYFSECRCIRCGTVSPLSEMRFPNGRRQTPIASNR